MRYWQVGAGDGNRDYSDVFLRFGVMLIGPGDHGDYFENRDSYQDRRHLDEHSITDVRTFAEDVQEDDVVVLRTASRARWRVEGIGYVRGEYIHLPVFDDVEGWQLQHGRFVDWFVPKHRNPIKGFKRGTFQRVKKKSTIKKVDRLLESGDRNRPSPVPKPPKKLDDNELIDRLIRSGLRPKDAEDFTETTNRIRRLVKWYKKYGADMGEHETRAFLIIPLLLALGWTERRLKIEWNRIDIAFFKEPLSKENRKRNKCVSILEAKSFPAALRPALRQAREYAKRYPECNRVIASDGSRYQLQVRGADGWEDSAYLNILNPKLRHPYLEDVGGAPDLFLDLMAR